MNFLLRIGLIFFVICITVIITCPFWCCFISITDNDNRNKYKNKYDSSDVLCTLFILIPFFAIIGAVFLIFGLLI